jgi:hypothetical protein
MKAVGYVRVSGGGKKALRDAREAEARQPVTVRFGCYPRLEPSPEVVKPLPLVAGDKLGLYEILSPICARGMAKSTGGTAFLVPPFFAGLQ